MVVAKGATEFHGVVLHSGTLARRYSLMMMGQQHWDGDFRHSIFRSRHYNVESIEFRLGSRVVPDTRLRADFEKADFSEMYLYCLESLGESVTRYGGVELIRPSEWKTGSFLFSADATVDLTADGDTRTAKESGSVSLTITFAKPLPDNVVLVVFSETDAQLSISAGGEVEVKD